MDSGSVYCNAVMLLGAVCMLFSVQDVDAQATNSTGVPGWGIALLTMMSILAALCLAFMMIIPCWCRNTKHDRQDGISFYSPHFMLSGGDSCQPAWQPTCQPACPPVREPAIQPVSQPSCQPECQPVCKPVCGPACRPVCEPICQPVCRPVCEPEC